jgi:hypothetical protein
VAGAADFHCHLPREFAADGGGIPRADDADGTFRQQARITLDADEGWRAIGHAEEGRIIGFRHRHEAGAHGFSAVEIALCGLGAIEPRRTGQATLSREFGDCLQRIARIAVSRHQRPERRWADVLAHREAKPVAALGLAEFALAHAVFDLPMRGSSPFKMRAILARCVRKTAAAMMAAGRTRSVSPTSQAATGRAGLPSAPRARKCGRRRPWRSRPQ